MVDEALLKDLKAKFDAGPSAADPEDMPKVFEYFKQVALENEDIKEEVEDMDILVQIVISDLEIKKWIGVKEGIITYGDDTTDNPSFTFTTTMEIAVGMLFGEVDATSAYMAGDITVEGNLQDAMAFQEIIELGMEAFEELTEDM